ncbi:MAG: DUF1304 domain-containing protein [Eudoraea sp.]|nr:DUF1304 domain-containing protein [Eudoraea sp.]NNK30168.1 DUF1304 domain-containing protein [Flavobacteriaceae bacterium]
MSVVVTVLTIAIALMHFYFLWLEMFAWTSRGRKVFKNFPQELFEPTKTLAANQGLYNGFLAAGLIWSVLIEDTEWQKAVALFFLACVAIAGIYGGLSADKKIFFVQGLPALITLSLILLL